MANAAWPEELTVTTADNEGNSETGKSGSWYIYQILQPFEKEIIKDGSVAASSNLSASLPAAWGRYDTG
jgi:hypothetical protein